MRRELYQLRLSGVSCPAHGYSYSEQGGSWISSFLPNYHARVQRHSYAGPTTSPWSAPQRLYVRVWYLSNRRQGMGKSASKWEINLGLQVDIGITIGWTRLGGLESHHAEAGEGMSQERHSLCPGGTLLFLSL